MRWGYTYLGIEKLVKKIIERHGTDNVASKVKLNINVDGVSLFKSSNEHLRPILGILYLFSPFIIALYFGSNK